LRAVLTELWKTIRAHWSEDLEMILAAKRTILPLGLLVFVVSVVATWWFSDKLHQSAIGGLTTTIETLKARLDLIRDQLGGKSAGEASSEIEA
jgi:hypothetical protein